MLNDSLIREQLGSKITLVYELGQQEQLVYGYQVSTLVSEAIGFYRRYWGIDLSDLYPVLIAAQPAYQLMVSMVSRQLANANMMEAAALVAGTAAAFKVPGNVFPLLYAAALREAGDIPAARDIAVKLLGTNAVDGDPASEIAQCSVEELFSPLDYYDVLNLVHTRLKPKTYLEIGVAQGRSLALARSGTSAFGVDPATGSKEGIFFHSPENTPHLFNLTSDDFFASCKLTGLFGQSAVDIAFLDGLHLFEQTLKDFINVERFSHSGSVIFIHDCLPVNSLVAERDRQSGFWVGDVWKIIPCLKAIRPDLDIVTLPVRPSGLAVIRNLDPTSRVLERQFGTITDHFNSLSLPESWEEKCKLLCVTEQSPEQLLDIR